MKSNESGAGLMATLFVVTLAAAVIAVIFTVTMTVGRNTKRTIDRTAALGYGDAVLESLFEQWRATMVASRGAANRGGGVPTEDLANLAVPSAADILPPSAQTTTVARVSAATPLLVALPTGRPVPENGSGKRGRLNYIADATITYQGLSGQEQVTLRRSFVRGASSLFDYFFFGTRPRVEFHPGPEMYVDGEVYVGGDLFTRHDSLHFLDDVTFTGEHKLAYSPDDKRSLAGTDIAADGTDDNWDKNNPPRNGKERKLFDADVARFDPSYLDIDPANDADTDGKPNNNGYHELVEEPAGTLVEREDPTHVNADPLYKQGDSNRLVDNADYRIYVDANNVVTIYKGPDTTPLAPDNSEYLALRPAVSVNTAIEDKREGGNTRNTTLDISKLYTNRTNLRDSQNSNDGFAIYIADRSFGTEVSTMIERPGYAGDAAVPGTPARPEVPAQPASNGKPAVPYQAAVPAVAPLPATPAGYQRVSSARMRGIKLVNGGKLPPEGLTIATPNAVYIQGDYNTGTEGAVRPTSNNPPGSYTPPNDKPSPIVSGYTKAAAAVVADAINILSNDWNDAKSTKSLNERVAANTTINAALIAGSVASNAAFERTYVENGQTKRDGAPTYSGGIENFVRFHEHWGDNKDLNFKAKYLTVKGTLALLFGSDQAIGRWSRASYSAPMRRWFYDTDFRSDYPPMFKAGPVYERGHWLTRQ